MVSEPSFYFFVTSSLFLCSGHVSANLNTDVRPRASFIAGNPRLPICNPDLASVSIPVSISCHRSPFRSLIIMSRISPDGSLSKSKPNANPAMIIRCNNYKTLEDLPIVQP